MADSSNSTRNLLPSHGRPSQSSIRQQNPGKTPWLAILCIILLMASVVVSIAIVSLSHHQPVASWKISPAVLLSVMSSIFVLTLEVLVAIGLTICWWRSAANGTTLKRLHYIWDGSNLLNLVPATMAGVDTRKVALIAVVIAVAKFATGPLLQRSTHSGNHLVGEDVTIKMHIAQQIPDGWFGTQGIAGAPGFASLQEWYLNNTISTPTDAGFYCKGNGTCGGSVTGAGINWGCDSTSQTLNLLDPVNENTVVFSITSDMNYNYGQPMLFLSAAYLSNVDGSCIGTITTDTCNIIAATVEYPVLMQNTTVTLNHNSLLTNRSVVSNYTSKGDQNSTTPNSTLAGPLTGLNLFMGDYIFTSAKLNYPPKTYDSVNSIADLFYDPNPSHYTSYAYEHCGLKWSKPTDYVIASFTEFMFRAALDVGHNESLFSNKDLQNFTLGFAGTELRYSSDFGCLAGAIILMLLSLLGVFVLLWGWWELGRPVTLSPLETAKAFGAPMLLGAGYTRDVKTIIEEIGDEKVAHDGDEMIWNGVMSASARWEMGQVPRVRSRNGSTGSGYDSPSGGSVHGNDEGGNPFGNEHAIISGGRTRILGDDGSGGGGRGRGKGKMRAGTRLRTIDEISM